MADNVHLGDGAYAWFDGYQFWLGANHHTNLTVALEPSVMLNFASYVAKTSPEFAETMARHLMEQATLEKSLRDRLGGGNAQETGET